MRKDRFANITFEHVYEKITKAIADRYPANYGRREMNMDECNKILLEFLKEADRVVAVPRQQRKSAGVAK